MIVVSDCWKYLFIVYCALESLVKM